MSGGVAGIASGGVAANNKGGSVREVLPAMGASGSAIGGSVGGAEVQSGDSANIGANSVMEVKGEKEKGSGGVDTTGGVGASGVTGNVDGAVGGAGASGGGEGGADCGEIPQMSRSRLREILHHAEGKCVKC